MIVALGAMLWTSLPYLVGYAVSTPAWRFGGSFIYPQDGYSYLAKMRQGAAGAWLIHLPYTSEPHDPALVWTLYPVLGKLAVLTGLSLEMTYQLARLAGGVALLGALALFLRAYVPHRAWRHFAFSLIVVSGGLGWLLGALFPKIIPLELLAPHLYVFTMLYSPPHMSLGLAVLLLMFAGLRRVLPSPARPVPGFSQEVGGEALAVGLLGAVLALIRPETAPIFWAVLVVYLIALKALGQPQGLPLLPTARRLLPTILGLPVVAALYAHVMLNPAFRAWMAQNPFPAPSPLDLALGLAPLLPFGLLALRERRWWRGPELLITVWALAVPLLAYMPVGSQSRLLSGIFIPWGILASYGWLRIRRRGAIHRALLRRDEQGAINRAPTGAVNVRPVTALKRLLRTKRRLTRVWLGTSALSALWFILLAGLYVGTRPADLFYAPAAEEMAGWLTEHAPDAPVLSAWRTGSLLAAQGTVRVFLGHPIETLDYAAKSTEVEHFFRAATQDEERSALLRRYDIGYVAYGPWERALGGFDPASALELRRAFAEGDYVLYEVVRGSN